ncbi:NRDE family protein [Ferrimonas gelatinilytica]|uniref:NRDE family protein n=1 Tax=Ferrimonas gelatinilytica TaxID=1255257 RepID=UPI0031E6BF54
MCLVAFRWQPGAPTPLVLLANRDEFYDRPTLPPHRWRKPDGLFAGQDQQAGGTWMAHHPDGRWGLITNYREWPPQSGPSRGQLLLDYLGRPELAPKFLTRIAPRARQFAGFNLLLGDRHGLYYFSNREGCVRTLQPGLYGLSNHLLDTPWPKVQRLKKALAQGLDSGASDGALLALLRDPTAAEDAALPDTGVGLALERRLSPIFIHSPDYGTRTTTLWRQHADGRLDWHVQHFDHQGALGPVRHHRLPTHQGDSLLLTNH